MGSDDCTPDAATAQAADYPVGSKLLLNGRWPVRVIGHTSLPDDLVVEWLGLRPLAALAGDKATICLKHLDRKPELSESQDADDC
jgi:hypothetical protein